MVNQKLERIRYTVTATAGTLPITLTNLKLHIRKDGNDEDTFLTTLINGTTSFLQKRLSRQFITATYEQYYDAFPSSISDPLELIINPASIINSIKYYDTDGVLQTWTASLYQSDLINEPALILPAYGQSWPVARDQLNSITVNYDAGYGVSDTDIPNNIKQTLYALAAYWDKNREPVGNERLLPHYLEHMIRGLEWEAQ